MLGMLVFGPGSGRAAQFRLRTQCHSRGGLVTLGDVAEIFAADRQQAEALAAIELFPAPPAARQRFVRLREIQDLLSMRGVNLAEHQFSGSSQVAVLGGDRPVHTERERPLSFSVARRANRRVSEAVVQYLQRYVSSDPSWIVKVELNPSHARLVADPGRGISITGGGAPWTGLQRFEVTIAGPDGPVKFPLDAQVALAPTVVVAVRSLPRGTVIRADDVQLQHGVARDRRSEGFSSIDRVVGKETTHAIAKGKVLQQGSVRAPLLVRRGEVVTVYARSAGICVQTVGRARDNGSLGDVIGVESLLDRKTYFARVSDVREVEVYARSRKADRVDTGGPSPVVRR